jgi:deazaflavin-dependent oxidoreductase (nitroreductase family)
VQSGGNNLAEKPDLSWPIRVGFVFHKVTNPILRLILRSRVHAMLSGQLILITYTGKKTGVKHTLPVQYAKSDNELLVIAGYHQHKRWWRNLRRQSTVSICYRGESTEASAMAYEGDVSAIVPRLPAYLKRFPQSARIRGLTLGPSGNVENIEKLREAAKEAVMVVIRMPNSAMRSKNC